jgi:hypothetical protein
MGDVVEEVRTMFEVLKDATIFIPSFCDEESNLTVY